MKKLFILLVGVLLLSSCSGDDEMGDVTTPDDHISETNVEANGHAYVDLGLSALWATCNIGAYAPTQIGDKYAFGETSTKSEYTNSNYIGGQGDVAKIRWGGDWRMPTRDELSEIFSNCTWKLNSRNGVEVITAIGPNGNSVDFPYCSYIGNSGLSGWYWSSTSYSSTKAYCLYFEDNQISWGKNDKYNGFLVRAVITNPNFNGGTNDNGNNDSGDSETDYEKPDIGFYDYTAGYTTLKVLYRIYNRDEAKVSSAKIYYGTTSNPTKIVSAIVSGSMITANISGLKSGTTYYVKCVATGRGGTTISETTRCMTSYQ